MLGGAIGVGLGFGLQKIAANYVSGFVILAERSVRIGDMVKVDTFEGRITDIRTRYTVIRSLGGREAIVPNETLITTKVENSSLADPRVLVQSAVPVAYGSDVRRLQPLLRGGDRRGSAGRRRARRRACSSPRSPPTAWSWPINFWIRDPENGQGNVKSEVNLAVLDVLRAEGIVFPSGQRRCWRWSPDAGATIAERIDAATPPGPASSAASDPTAS